VLPCGIASLSANIFTLPYSPSKPGAIFKRFSLTRLMPSANSGVDSFSISKIEASIKIANSLPKILINLSYSASTFFELV